MKFTFWLESQNTNKIVFTSFFNDGTITVYINGRRHVYITDAVYHGPWQNRLDHLRNNPAAYQKWAAIILNQIQDMVKKGRAQEENDSTETTPMSQKFLF